jgi:hypothetical protein
VPQDDSHQHSGGRALSRRDALRLGAGAGALAVVAPHVARFGGASGVVDINDAQPAMTAIPNWPVPSIVTRAQWGANESLRKSGRLYDSSILKLVVHHTGTPNSVTDYKALCRGILANETSGEYIDIAYNWLIDPNGRIYEGRWAQDYGDAPHTGEKNNVNVRGAHALYHNTRTIGVALMGNFDAVTPPSAMLDGLVTLLAWKCARWGISPTAHGSYLAGNNVVHDLYNICGHRDTYATACPGARMEGLLPDIRSRVAARITGAGYWVASDAGKVLAFGGAPRRGDATTLTAPAAGIAGHPSGGAYWLFSGDGNVYAFGGARNYGSMRGRRLNAPIVGMAPTPTGKGYYLVGRDGGVFCFGDAVFRGSTGNKRLNASVLGLTPTSSGRGYWIFARDGGVFSFGDARFYGSTGNIRLQRPVVGMAARPQNDGYWMVAEDGGIFSFGRAPFKGSGARSSSTSRCIAMLPSTSGNGYVILRRDGTVSAFGDAPYLGSARGRVGTGAVGIAGRLKARL